MFERYRMYFRSRVYYARTRLPWRVTHNEQSLTSDEDEPETRAVMSRPWIKANKPVRKVADDDKPKWKLGAIKRRSMLHHG
jgi:hypothetical protein